MWGLISKSHLNHNMLITNHKRQSIRTPVITACHLTSSDSQGWSLLLLITKLFLQLPKYVLFRKIVIFHFKSNASTQAPPPMEYCLTNRSMVTILVKFYFFIFKFTMLRKTILNTGCQPKFENQSSSSMRYKAHNSILCKQSAGHPFVYLYILNVVKKLQV